jgi:hypothetical protein
MATRSNTYRNMSFLDGIRNRNGMEGLKRTFHDIAGNDRQNAANLLNDSAVHFPSLFALQPEIRKHDLYEHLSGRNKFALDFTGHVLAGTIAESYGPEADDHPHLKWMLDTGHASDGMNDQYDDVMDKAALLLSRVYRDKPCLRPIENMIFNRHQKGAYIYDLVWAYFESSEPDDLILLAKRLRSSNKKDVELARRLLNFVPCIENNEEHNPEMLYRCTAGWIRRNRNRLYYTGESMQMSGNPRRYALRGGQQDAAGGDGND